MRVVDGGERACRSCGVCCVHLPMPAGLVGPHRKPAGVPCPHSGKDECRIYPRRPKACAKFRCAWLADASWPVGWRPDFSGLLCLRETVNGVPMAAVYEIHSDALQRSLSAEILAELKRTTATVVAIDGRQRRKLVSFAADAVPEPTASSRRKAA